MDKTEKIFECTEFIPGEEEPKSIETTAVEPIYEPVTIPETEYNEAESKDADEEAAKENNHGFLKLISGALSIIFCTCSAAMYISGAVFAAGKNLGEGIENILTREVFEQNAEKIKETDDFYEGTSETDIPDTSATEPGQSLSPSEPSDEPDITKPVLYPSERTNLAVSPDKIYQMKNETEFSPDTQALLKLGNQNAKCDEIYRKYGSNAPAVLIVHTHGTEAYSENEEDYSSDESFRSQDTDKNVVAVGEAMADVFRKAGINVIHDTEMYDKESYKDSYSRSFAAVKEWLEKYPSITYVFDVHRDAIIRSDKTKICPVGSYNDTETAQVMLVVGTNEGGANHDEWEKNLSFALDAQTSLTKISNSLARNINLRSAAFNQGLSSGYLLLEVGACGNTLIQAKRCSVLAAAALSETITGKEYPISAAELLSEYE